MHREAASVRTGVLALALAGVFLGAVPAQAADVYEEEYRPRPRVYERYEQRAPVYVQPQYPRIERRVEVEEGVCRVLHRRGFDAYGREVIRRVRVCEEGMVHPGPRGPYVARGPRPYDDYVPRPPRPIGPGVRPGVVIGPEPDDDFED
jgi:hypothetical protein